MRHSLYRLASLCCLLLMLSGCLFSASHMARMDPTKSKCTTLGEVFDLTSTPAGYEIQINNDPTDNTRKPLRYLYEYINYITWYATEAIYRGIAEDTDFKEVLTALVGLTIAFYSIAVVLAIVPYNLNDVVIFGIKIAIVFAFAVNWQVFYDLIFVPMEGVLVRNSGSNSMQSEGAVYVLTSLASHVMGSVEDDSVTPVFDVLNSIDSLIAMMVSWNFWKLIFALLAAGLQGWLYAGLLVAMLFAYFWAIVAALQVLFISMIARCLLYSVAPLIFVLLLFEHTKAFFFAWAEQILSYAMQPIFLFMWLGMMNTHIMEFVSQIPVDSAQTICYLPYISLPVVSFMPRLQWWVFSDGTLSNTEPRGPFADMPIHFWYMLGAIGMSYILHSMVTWTVDLAKNISGGVAGLANVQAYGYQTVKGASTSPFYAGLAMFRGAFAGSGESVGVASRKTRRRGVVGVAQDFVQGKGFRPGHHIIGGAQESMSKTRKKVGQDLVGTFNQEFGLSEKGKNSPWSGHKKTHTGDIRGGAPKSGNSPWGKDDDKSSGGNSPWGKDDGEDGGGKNSPWS